MAMTMATRVLYCILLHSLPMGIFAISFPKANPLSPFRSVVHFMRGNKPRPELIEHEYSLPEGYGCEDLRGQKNEPMPDGVRSWLKKVKGWLKTPASSVYRATTEQDQGWNGFCELEWPLCPDAVANADYSYYWRGLGPRWTRFAGAVDKLYCLNNGWLKPEIASIVRNFTALKTKGEELCKTTYNAPHLKRDEMTVAGGIIKAVETGIVHTTAAIALGATDYPFIMDKKAAAIAAAWNCAMGDLSCDLAYCNYAYCELPDGSAGVMDECEGWDAVKGMPALYK